MAAFEELPDELMTLILLKLPVKSVLRLKCLRKSWYSLIKSPYFTHLHRSSSSSTSSSSSINYDCFLVRRFIEKQQQQQIVLSLHSYETLDDLGNQINIPIPNYRGWLCGSCDGFVCLADFNGKILVCNPTIRELRQLFVPTPLNFYIQSVAFGLDPNTGQYTVIMIGAPPYGVLFARLYDFSTDTWRETDAIFPDGPFGYSRRAISFNGAFHWIPCAENPLLTFHISNEVTGFIPLPKYIDISDDIVDLSYAMELCVSSKSQLSLIFCDSNELFHIWVMTEYGVKESWTLLFCIDPLSENYESVAFWDEQRLLLSSEEGEERQLVSWDLQHENSEEEGEDLQHENSEEEGEDLQHGNSEEEGEDLQHENLRHFPIHGDFELCPLSQSLVSVFELGD